MNAELAAVFFALLSAISWGAGDFSGGVASRRLNPYLIALLVHATGFLLFVTLALLRAEAFQPRDIPWSVAAGAAGCVGLVFLYRALEAGQMGLAAPIAGVVGAALAALVGFGLEGLPTPLQLLGFGVGLLGVWLAARPEGHAGPARGLGFAFLAGLGFGGYFALIHPVEGLFWPSALVKLVAATLTLGLVFWLGAFRRATRLTASLGWVGLAGVLDAGGSVLFLVAAQTGRLDVAAVISSLYPAFTALLAWALLREHLSRGQTVGVLLSLVAIALIASG
ncbi:MAG: DMT family transporter [Meiothermus sp.]|uniref:DMT family transporter n=1 Tax=Meiothermus sp. TaxID=1955249 RepID=UPI0025DB134A|nr:DMT family transporter [Meiothermus sp.]MCS7068430.1 DMT family transporter [Meiothermus sp.]MDW8425217.1 DMT family transporter [Meiothermus sp.]